MVCCQGVCVPKQRLTEWPREFGDAVEVVSELSQRVQDVVRALPNLPHSSSYRRREALVGGLGAAYSCEEVVSAFCRDARLPESIRQHSAKDLLQLRRQIRPVAVEVVEGLSMADQLQKVGEQRRDRLCPQRSSSLIRRRALPKLLSRGSKQRLGQSQRELLRSLKHCRLQSLAFASEWLVRPVLYAAEVVRSEEVWQLTHAEDAAERLEVGDGLGEGIVAPGVLDLVQHLPHALFLRSFV